MVLGQVPPEEARRWQHKAAVLVNPRRGDEDFVPYSFPSKNIEYLLTGKPVVAYLLPGMPARYADFLCQIDQELPAAEAIANAVTQALTDESISAGNPFVKYARDNLNARNIARTIIEINK